VARVSCVGTCQCQSLTLDAHQNERRVSLEQVSPPITVYGLAARCALRVQVLPDSRSGGHKFKVTSVAAVSTPHGTLHTVGATAQNDAKPNIGPWATKTAAAADASWQSQISNAFRFIQRAGSDVRPPADDTGMTGHTSLQ